MATTTKASDQQEQIRSLLLELMPSDEDSSDEDPVSTSKPGRSRGNRGIVVTGSSSSSSTAAKRSKAAAMSRHKPQERSIKTQERIDRKLKFLKATHNGTFPTFSGPPDPGCGFEVMRYTNELDPRYVPDEKGGKGLVLHKAASYDKDLPRVRLVLEDAREAHWKLTAPKGFAALKGIPELQQLLAYTAAQVVEFLSANFDKLDDDDDDRMNTTLIGQLCPALRLCLAAEVAMGLMCDSEPPPPDTPEHAGALLSFLEFARVLAQRECHHRREEGLITSWAQRPALYADVKPLLELYMCPDPHAPLQILQQAASQRDLTSSSTTTSSSSSSSGGGGGGNNTGVAAAAEAATAAAGAAAGAVAVAAADSLAADFMPGNVVLAALQCATLMLDDRGGGTCNGDSCSSSLTPSTPPQSPLRQQQQQQQTGEEASLLEGGSNSISNSRKGAAAAAADSGANALSPAAAKKLWLVLQKLQASSSHHHHHQQQQQQQDESRGDEAVLVQPEGPEQPQQPGQQPGQQQQRQHVADVSGLVNFTLELLDQHFQQRGKYVAAAVADACQAQALAAKQSEAAEGTAAAPPAPPAAAAEAPADATHDSTCACISCICQREENAMLASADDVAWTMAVLAGGMAFARLLSGGGRPASQPAAAAAGPSHFQPCPVQTALLFSALEGLFFAVREELRECSARQEAFACEKCSLLEVQSHLDDKEVDEQARGPQKAEIVSKLLQFMHLACSLSDHPAATKALCSPSPSSSSSSTAHSMQQQQQADKERALHEAVAGSDQKLSEVFKFLRNQQRLFANSDAPLAWFSTSFTQLGVQQLSPACLHPAVSLQQPSAAGGAAAAAADSGAAAAGAATAAAVDGDDAEEIKPRHQLWEIWTKLQGTVAQKHLQVQLQQQQQAAGAQQSQLPATGTGDAPDQEAAAAAAGGVVGAEQGASQRHLLDFVASFFFEQDVEDLWQHLLTPVVRWQHSWSRHAAQAAQFVDAYEQRLFKELENKRIEAQRKRRNAKRDKRQSAAAGPAADLKRLQQKLLASSSSSSSEDDGGDDEAAADKGDKLDGGGAAAGSSSSSRRQTTVISDDEAEEDTWEQCCIMCAAEATTSRAAAASSSSSSSSTSGGHPGLYSRFPVSWADPCMMRRLLWDLLGKLKPTAQAWFREHANMCPHRNKPRLWHMVAVSIARHIWAPPGVWSQASEQQMSLVTPRFARMPLHAGLDDHEARAQYARQLSAAATHRDVLLDTAALLSMQVLLALDPHAASVQPKPELLYYTPSGFHAAVCKTLMQALLLPQPPAAPAWPAGTAAALSVVVRDKRPEQQQEQQEEQQQQQQQSKREFQQHYLQSWGQQMFPAWYVWWHIGLLAYQQHQQHQQQAQAQQQTAPAVQGPVQQHRPSIAQPSASGADLSQQQQQQQRQQEGGKQQLGRNLRMATASTRQGSSELPSPRDEDGQPPDVAATAAAESSAGTAPWRSSAKGRTPALVVATPKQGAHAGNNSSSSSNSNSSSAVTAGPPSMQELYNNPDARVFAVGYAMRQTSSGAQLHRLMAAPPAAESVQEGVFNHVLQVYPGERCAVCNRHVLSTETYNVCTKCAAAFCSKECEDLIIGGTPHACEADPTVQVACSRHWRVLGLLKPVQQAPAAAVAAAAAVPSCIPPAVHNVLPQVLAQQQQQPFPIYQTARARFEAAPTAEAQTHLPQIECARDAAAAGIEALRAQVLGSSDSDGTMSGSGGGGSSSSSSWARGGRFYGSSAPYRDRLADGGARSTLDSAGDSGMVVVVGNDADVDDIAGELSRMLPVVAASGTRRVLIRRSNGVPECLLDLSGDMQARAGSSRLPEAEGPSNRTSSLLQEQQQERHAKLLEGAHYGAAAARAYGPAPHAAAAAAAAAAAGLRHPAGASDSD